MLDKRFFPRQAVASGGNRWDWALLPLVLATLFALAFGGSQMARPYELGQPLPIDSRGRLSPHNQKLFPPSATSA